ncbi:MAG: class I adenylate-forming enzyme family protein, partial [Nitrospinaceae bacterium]
MTSTFYDELKRHALERPDHPAIMDAAGALSYSQFLDQVERFAGGLGTLPLTAHSKLGLMCLNQREFLIALLGAFLKGLPIVPYNYLLTPEDLAFITEDAGVDLILTHPMFVKPEAVPFFSQFKVRLVTGPEPGLAGFDARPWPAFLQQGQTGGGRHRREPGIPDVILYTSGTTAQPKGVMLNENQFFANTTGVGAHLEFLPEDRGIMALPLFHSFGNIIALVFLRAGSTLILIPQFQPKTILAAITEHRATVLPLVPTIYSFLVQLYERGGYDVSSLRYCVSGGAALPQALFHHVERTLGCTVLEGYGLTETSPVIAVNTMAQGSVPGSVGPVLPNLQVRIVNADGAAVAPGEVGEIVVQGETVMSGYWN